MDQLDGRVAVVTGAASGIGLGMARAFAAEGMKVVLADVDVAGLDAAAASLDAETLAVPTDVADAGAVARLADRTVEHFGGVHVVCNNAGVFTIGYQWETSLEDWSWVLGVNLTGVIHGIHSFVPRMLASGEPGHVVNTASMGGLIASPLTGPYGASKHAVVGISKGLRAELKMTRQPVGVSVVCPGEVATGILEHLRARYGDDEVPPVVQTVLDRLEGRLDSMGMTIDDAGAMVARAVRDDQFWVFPNAEFHLDAYRKDLDEIFG